eukprot:TRINITY_DN2919_c0_g2_i1.p1 TRINITY_DN2919_c0_g2~~TRINITY_DN2919_c0_g2_i1.p1  ORF type:complete len:503 (+),score=131.01 TRINITY_DN2919_c0_g2_i1:108-1616(+)
MGNKTSMYKEVYHLQEGVKSKSPIKTIAAYLNYAVFPVGGIISVSSDCIESFNAIEGTRADRFLPPAEITCSDFTPSPRTLSIGLSNGKVLLADPDKLTPVITLHYDPKQEQEVAVTAVNCRLAGRVVVGYSNCIAKEFRVGEDVAFNVFVTLGVAQVAASGEEGVEKPVSCVEVEGEHVFIVQRGSEKSIVRVYKSGTSASQTTIACDFVLVSMKVMEKYNAILVFSPENEVFIYNYIDGEFALKLSLNIQGIPEDDKLRYASLLPCTLQIQKIYKAASRDENLLYIGYDSGHILAGRFAMSISETSKIQCTFSPHNIYKASDKIDPTIVPSIIHLYVDPVTDHLLATVNGNMCLIERAVMRVLNPNQAKALDDEDKVKNSSFLYRIGVWKPPIAPDTANHEFESIKEAKKEANPSEVVKERQKSEEKKEKAEDAKKIQEERQIMERLAKAAQEIKEVSSSPKIVEARRIEAEAAGDETPVEENVLKRESSEDLEYKINLN